MASKKRIVSLFGRKRYWYHVSTTLREQRITLKPWDGRQAVNRGPLEPSGRRICVAPTIEQCIVAIPYHLGATISIYRTVRQRKATEPYDVFDAKVTGEGWLKSPTAFIKIGQLDFNDIEKKMNIEQVIDEVASEGNLKESKRGLRWWKKIRPKRFIKST